LETAVLGGLDHSRRSLHGDRYMYIDSIRAIAVLLVMVTHFSESVIGSSKFAAAHGSYLYTISHDLDFGRIGVVLFFGVSGFVIPSSLRKGSSIGHFLIKRLFRLYPAYWLSIPAALAAQYWLWGGDLPMPVILSNLTMFQKFMGYPYVQGLYWTLTLELVFYGLCVVLFFAQCLTNVRLLLIISGLSGLLFMNLLDTISIHDYAWPSLTLGIVDSDWFSLPFALSVMCFGAALRQITEGNGALVEKLMLSAVGVFWLVVFPVFGVISYILHDHNMDIVREYAPLPIAVALFCLLCGPVKIRVKALADLGIVSYSLYLFHSIIMFPTIWLIRVHWQNIGIDTNVWCLGMFILSLGLSVIIYNAVEKPGIMIGRWLVTRRQRGKVLSSPLQSRA
jgi:peptidoglycan/LPS O-acetylase OafA/YrhL